MQLFSVSCNLVIVDDILTTNYLKSEIALDKLQLQMTFLSEPESESKEGKRLGGDTGTVTSRHLSHSLTCYTQLHKLTDLNLFV